MSGTIWESDEAYDTEADEAYFDSEELGEDYGEDFGEAVGSKSRRRRRNQKHLRSQGVGGLSVRGTEGQVHRVPFPQKLATAKETNRGFTVLSDDLDRLEAKLKAKGKRDSAVTGVVTLGIGVPLTILGIVHAADQNDNPHKFKAWSKEQTTKVAAATSAAQLLTTGATLALDRHYSHSKIALAADLFAAGQLLTFFGIRLINVEGRVNVAARFQMGETVTIADHSGKHTGPITAVTVQDKSGSHTGPIS